MSGFSSPSDSFLSCFCFKLLRKSGILYIFRITHLKGFLEQLLKKNQTGMLQIAIDPDLDQNYINSWKVTQVSAT